MTDMEQTHMLDINSTNRLRSIRRRVRKVIRLVKSAFNRDHIINIGRYRREDDADERMFHACFIILGKYVEKELGRLSGDCSAFMGYATYRVDGSDEKAIELWLWYKNARPIDLCKYETYLKAPFIRNIHSYEAIQKKDTQKLAELMTIRNSLWI